MIHGNSIYFLKYWMRLNVTMWTILGGGTKMVAGAIAQNNEQSFPDRQKTIDRGTIIPSKTTYKMR